MPPQNSGLQIKLSFVAVAVWMTICGAVLALRPSALTVILISMASYASLGGAYFLVHRLLVRVRGISSAISAAADQVAAGASQLSAGSQSLAQGVSKQAESVGEVSGTSELMASITRQSAESGRAAMELMNRAEQLAAQAAQGLEAMVGSIREIGSSAGKISGITRIVDEIAFQTNILALNAAVEAARAGASGSGFAVVADEVRNLAQRSGRAAEDIVLLVEESITRTQEGMAKLDQVSGAMRALIESTAKVKEFVDETTLTGEELARGTEQISTNMRELEELTQGTAASSEQTAATGQEMSSQAQSMRDLVSHLRALSGETR